MAQLAKTEEDIDIDLRIEYLQKAVASGDCAYRLEHTSKSGYISANSSSASHLAPMEQGILDTVNDLKDSLEVAG